MSHSTKVREKRSDLEILYDKIKAIRLAMMTTADADGVLHSRPMVTQDPKDMKSDGYLWFLTYASASKVGEVEKNHHVNLAYAKSDDNLFVSVSGTAECVHDKARVKALWSPLYKTWFPNGPDDPAIALLRVHVEHAEYWNAPAGKMGLLYTITKGLTSGGKETPPGEDVKLDV
ncbi:pyridoxamine 5-phosphate oxidase family protein [Ktedonobacteria bacterium brp13]|nr:pyridoxamine 5-phosphate oxidase family protein [Ktedonobacteria bacterium brp13]